MIGQTISHYRIVEKIGEGGMGEVYLAEDTSLPRRVALKFLPPALADDELAHKRFLREASSAAALDHPFICHIHEVIRDDSRDVIVMEYVDGQTLQQKIAEGPLALREALRIGLEVSEALELAHKKDIIHRDLKPSNIMLTADGHAEIMDFGLAKKVGQEDGTEQDLTTALTKEGSTLGTLPYMSPEQLKAEAVDHRTDIFSFGVILYEMLTGVHPFRKARQVETVGAILHQEPERLDRFLKNAPELLEHTLGKMLAKTPGDRYQSVHEVQTDLNAIAAESQTRIRRIPHWYLWAVGVGSLITIAVVVGVMLWQWPSRGLLSSPPPHLKITPFTTDGGIKQPPRFSRDGERVAYSWDATGGGNRDIYVKALGPGAAPLRLTDDPSGDVFPAWSPDGRQIAFVRYSHNGTAAIYLVPSMGGPERKLVDREGALQLGFAGSLLPFSWSPDGKTLIFSESKTREGPARIVAISIEALEKRAVTTPPEDTLGDVFPAFSPDGSQIAFLRSGSRVLGKLDVWVQPAKGGEARRLTQLEFEVGGLLAWTSDGRSILFHSAPVDASPQLSRVDVSSGRVDAIPGLGRNVGNVDVWRDRLVFQEVQPLDWDIHRIPVAAVDRTDSEKLISSSRNEYNADFSPDGGRIVFQSERGGGFNIWMCNSDGSNPIQLTSFKEHSGTPRWSPDGKMIVFDSLHSGNWDLWLIDPEGGIPRQLTTNPSDEGMGTWSHDGKWIYFTSLRTGRTEIYRMPAEGGATEQLSKKGGWYALESRDGRYLYYKRATKPGPLFRLTTDGEGEEEQVLPEVFWRDWAVGTRGIYFVERDGQDYSIHLFDLETGENTELYRRQKALPHQELAVSPDEKWLLFSESPVPRAELMLAENFQ
ncbi:MAG: protein kinase [Acidobacteriota bacterium]